MAEGNISKPIDLKYGVVLGTDYGDIPADAVSFEITLPITTLYGGAFKYYGYGNTVAWTYRGNSGGVVIVRIQNMVNTLLRASDWSFYYIGQ